MDFGIRIEKLEDDRFALKMISEPANSTVRLTASLDEMKALRKAIDEAISSQRVWNVEFE